MEKLYIEPTLSFKTPALIHFGSWDMGLQAEPGVMIQIPYTFVDVDYIDRNTSVSYEKGRSAHASDWYFWDLRTILRFSSDDIFIAVGYGLEGAIPDLATKRIRENEMYPYLKSGDNYTAINNACEKLMGLAKGEINVKDYAKQKGSPDGWLKTIIIIIVILIIVGKFFGGGGGTTYHGGRYYGGGFGGGSFGGGRSSGGGGFGGFGGGSFGGGGSGGKW